MEDQHAGHSGYPKELARNLISIRLGGRGIAAGTGNSELAAADELVGVGIGGGLGSKLNAHVALSPGGQLRRLFPSIGIPPMGFNTLDEGAHRH